VAEKTKELIQAKEKAEESDKLKSAFLANMSHEIRTPLNGIIGFIGFLNNDILSADKRREYINIISNSGSQLAKLIDDIVDLSKIEAKQMNIRPKMTQLNELMNELYTFFETFVQANNGRYVALILDNSGFIDNCTIYIDQMRLRQIITNLIGNASKFTEKGYIRFGYRFAPPDKLEFFVEDTGIGLPSHQQQVIFERFRQAEMKTTRQYRGTGLGLTISHNLAKLMGGDIWVQSTEGMGSTFYFTTSFLPISHADENIFLETSDEIPLGNRSALVITQTELNGIYYKKILESAGIQVIMTHSVNEWADLSAKHIDISIVFAEADLIAAGNPNIFRRKKKISLTLLVPEFNDFYRNIITESRCNAALLYNASSEELIKSMNN
jgi:nitrogen-specific signal transduction histidine kinase